MKILFRVLVHPGGQTPLRRATGPGCIIVPDLPDTVKNEDTWSSLMPEEEREFFDFSDLVKRAFCKVSSA